MAEEQKTTVNGINVEQLIQESHDPDTPHKHKKGQWYQGWSMYDIPYASRYDVQVNIPADDLPKDGVESNVVYQMLHDELTLDGNPNLNLASFVHTWVPDECTRLMTENLTKNLVDQDEYPACTEIHNRCISMISGLWNHPKNATPMGTATTGSSEAIMLGGMSMKRRWQEKMKKAGKDIHNPGPNIIMGAEAQVALEKFARYFEVEARLVPITEESHYVLDPEKVLDYCDENTIGIFVILGSTYSGEFENVKAIADKLDEYEKKTGIHIPIHVDAASGGFVAPFVYPDLEWDFRIPRVCSINASGHKYGMSTVGVGWCIWRSDKYLPKEMIFELHYLGETDYSFNLNFSRPAHPILGQMFCFLNLGFSGYRRVIHADLTKARILSRALEKSGLFTILSEIHIPVDNPKTKDDTDPTYYRPGLPVVSFRFTDEIKAKYPHVQQRWVQEQLRAIGWIVPNYALPPACEKTEILRVVVRESLSGDLERKLITDIIKVTEGLLKGEGPSYPMSQATKSPPHATRPRRTENHKDHEKISKHTKAHNHVC